MSLSTVDLILLLIIIAKNIFNVCKVIEM